MIEERSIKTVLGDDAEVVVYFDYEPYDPGDKNQPPTVPDVTLNAVCVNGDKDKDIFHHLNADCIADLEVECLDSIMNEANGDEWT